MLSVKLYPSFGVRPEQFLFMVCGTRAHGSKKIRKPYSVNLTLNLVELLGIFVFFPFLSI